jgi:hypothetical protein
MAERKTTTTTTTTRRKKSTSSDDTQVLEAKKTPKTRAKAAGSEEKPKAAAKKSSTETKSTAKKTKKADIFGVYFKKPAHWGTPVYIYFWNLNPAGVIEEVSWPGVPMQNDGNDWYKADLKGINSANVIFHDNTGDINKTSDLFREGSGWFVDGVWIDEDPR